MPRLNPFLLSIIILCNSVLMVAQSPSPCDDFDPDSLMQFITVDDPIRTYNQDTFCIDFLTHNFNNIQGFVFTFRFDTLYLEFVSLSTPPGQLYGPFAYNDIDRDDGYVGVLWTNFEAGGASLADSTLVITLCLQAVRDSIACTPLRFNEPNYYQPETGITFYVESELCVDSTLLVNGKDSLCIKIGETEMVGLIDDIAQAGLNTLAYPNPASDFLHLQSIKQAKKILIYNLHGHLFLQQYNSEKLDISSLSPGIYLLVVEYGYGYREVLKFVKE